MTSTRGSGGAVRSPGYTICDVGIGDVFAATLDV
jgi:hypothetical protein